MLTSFAFAEATRNELSAPRCPSRRRLNDGLTREKTREEEVEITLVFSEAHPGDKLQGRPILLGFGEKTIQISFFFSFWPISLAWRKRACCCWSGRVA